MGNINHTKSENFISTEGREGYFVLVVHIETSVTSPDEIRLDMQGAGRDYIEGIGDQAWYTRFDNGAHNVIFHVAEKNLIVELSGSTRQHTEADAWVDRDTLFEVARQVAARL